MALRTLLLFIISDCAISLPMRPQSRIINGVPTTTNKYPWMVSIQYHYSFNSYDDRAHVCSGTLIRSTYPAAVLTAGHCVGDQILGSDGTIYHVDIGRTHPHDDLNDSLSDYVTLRAFYYYRDSKYDEQLSGSTVNLLTDYDIG